VDIALATRGLHRLHLLQRSLGRLSEPYDRRFFLLE
jgi:hypothetical protein